MSSWKQIKVGSLSCSSKLPFQFLRGHSVLGLRHQENREEPRLQRGFRLVENRSCGGVKLRSTPRAGIRSALCDSVKAIRLPALASRSFGPASAVDELQTSCVIREVGIKAFERVFHWTSFCARPNALRGPLAIVWCGLRSRLVGSSWVCLGPTARGLARRGSFHVFVDYFPLRSTTQCVAGGVVARNTVPDTHSLVCPDLHAMLCDAFAGKSLAPRRDLNRLKEIPSAVVLDVVLVECVFHILLSSSPGSFPSTASISHNCLCDARIIFNKVVSH